MRLVVMANRVGEDSTRAIATISVDETGQFVVDASDIEVRQDLEALIDKQIRAGGFIAQVSRYEPDDEHPEQHVTYARKQNPQDTYFDWALESTVSMFWTGEQVGDFEINGLASHIQD